MKMCSVVGKKRADVRFVSSYLHKIHIRTSYKMYACYTTQRAVTSFTHKHKIEVPRESHVCILN